VTKLCSCALIYGDTRMRVTWADACTNGGPSVPTAKCVRCGIAVVLSEDDVREIQARAKRSGDQDAKDQADR
jgi:hypothetical protein